MTQIKELIGRIIMRDAVPMKVLVVEEETLIWKRVDTADAEAEKVQVDEVIQHATMVDFTQEYRCVDHLRQLLDVGHLLYGVDGCKKKVVEFKTYLSEVGWSRDAIASIEEKAIEWSYWNWDVGKSAEGGFAVYDKKRQA